MLPLAALIASLVRWVMQGSGNLYTATHKRFYVPDPDLEWRESSQHPIWLGLEVCAIIAAIVVGLAIAGWFIRRRERKRERPSIVLRILTWLVAIPPLAVPILAFASGPGPADARDTRPPPVAHVGSAGASGIAGSLPAPAGRYEVVAHDGTSVTAHLSAGGETFDAVFRGDVKGTWQGDPRDLTKPTTAELSVATASVDTGIDERSKHARESYLVADKYPRITFKLDQVVSAHQDGPDKLAFRAKGTVGLIGKTHVVDVAGTLRKPDPSALQRLGITGEALLVQADFSLAIQETALAPDASDFDGDRIPIHVSLVLRHTGG